MLSSRSRFATARAPVSYRPLRLRVAASRAAVSDPTARDSMWSASERPWLFRARLETGKAAHFFAKKKRRVEGARAYVRRETKLMLG
jgi:hypothetical protein